MCGIVGYVGDRNVIGVLLGGLKRLEYRGYDSAGVAVVGYDGALHLAKRAGRLKVLRRELEAINLPPARLGIAHTRWATHGSPSDENAHPHLSQDGRLALIHNGIIENYARLKAELMESGCSFTSDTDTEVAAKLLGLAYEQTGDLVEAFRRVVSRLEGAFTLLAIHRSQPNVVVGMRRNSPLVVGLGERENFLASDVAAFAEYSQRAIALGQDQIVSISSSSVEVIDLDGRAAEVEDFVVDWKPQAADKGGWSSFMLKEIFEEPQAASATLESRVFESGVVLEELAGLDVAQIDRLVLLGCGTASYAAQTARYAMEKWTDLPVEVELSHEFRYREPALNSRTLVISVSQSGETMDTLMAIRYALAHGAKTLSVSNVAGSTIARECHASIQIKAGPEVAVASTKAFMCQIVALYLLGLYMGQHRGSLEKAELDRALAQLLSLPEKISRALENYETVRRLALWMSDSRSVLFLGRHVGYPIALEAALKLKELAYIHAEGFAAGELKHGPIALIEAGQPVFVIVPSPIGSPLLHAKVVSNIQEIRARGARVIVVAEEGDAAVLPYADQVLPIPLADLSFEPLLAIVPLQVFALELAAAKGLDVDQPRNLAKSVTVE